jgi:hypothetical protein
MTYAARQKMHDAANAPGMTTTLIVLSVVISAAVLCYAGKIPGAALIGLYSTIVGGVLVRAGVSSGSAAATAPPPPAD